MTAGLMVMTLIIEGATSLKEKRMVLNRIKDRVRKRFNVSLIESDHQDMHQKAEFSFLLLAHSRSLAEQQLDNLERFIIDLFPGRHLIAHREYIDGLDK